MLLTTRRELLRLWGLAVPPFVLEPLVVRAQADASPTPAESAVGVTPKNYRYPPLNVLR